MTLQGYVRKDGSVGFRNHVLVVPLTGCLEFLAWRIADRVEGATALVHPNGCDLQGGDGELLGRLLGHLATHPNVGAVLFLEMGCSATRVLRLPELVAQSGRPVAEVDAHVVGGSTRTIEEGVRAAGDLAAGLASQKRHEVPLSALTLGTKCGSSNADSFSHCHPVLGAACDRLADAGATVVLSEDCELLAGADLLAARAATPGVAADIRAMADTLQGYWTSRFSLSLIPDDPDGRERARRRSLEHAAKAGSRPIRRVVDMRDRVQGPGLVILNAPNTDLESVTCLAASGCQIIAFTTGRGTVVGSPVSATVKMTATPATWERMRENLDLDVSGYKTGSLSLDEAAERTFQHLIAAANGAPQRAEVLKHWEIAFPIRGVTF
jgi:altronate dehydratase large subunit